MFLGTAGVMRSGYFGPGGAESAADYLPGFMHIALRMMGGSRGLGSERVGCGW